MKSRIIYLCLIVILAASIFTNLILLIDNSASAVTVKSLTSEISSLKASANSEEKPSISSASKDDWLSYNISIEP